MKKLKIRLKNNYLIIIEKYKVGGSVIENYSLQKLYKYFF